MYEFWVSMLGGGFVGAAVVVFLFKVLIKNSLKKTLKKYQHELDVTKNSLQVQLSLYAHQHNLQYSIYEESRRQSIQKIYSAVVSTSMIRAGFKKFASLDKIEDQNQYCSIYFVAFKETFDSFDEMFKKITKAYAILENEVIYIDYETEQLINDALSSIFKLYNESHQRLQTEHEKAQNLFSDKLLTKENSPLKFDVFYDVVMKAWNINTLVARGNLKLDLRKSLKAESIKPDKSSESPM